MSYLRRACCLLCGDVFRRVHGQGHYFCGECAVHRRDRVTALSAWISVERRRVQANPLHRLNDSALIERILPIPVGVR